LKDSKNILICPLYWGLGHATRDLPIIRKFQAEGHKIFIAANKELKTFFKGELKNFTFISFPNYTLSYSSNNSQVLKLLVQLPKIFVSTYKEHFKLKKLVKEYQVDMVISDNRYGLFNKKVETVFIGHQLNILLPKRIQFLQILVNRINNWFLKRFDQVWVPDFNGKDNLAGKLSQNSSLENIKYIGPLSRFNTEELGTKDKEYILVILSGAEPQRSILEQKIFKQIKQSNHRFIMVRGTNEPLPYTTNSNSETFNLLNTKELEPLIKNAKLIISRSGYSSIMDYIVMKRNALLIPTPGQTEQEYLAQKLMAENKFYSVLQNELNLEKDILRALEF